LIISKPGKYTDDQFTANWDREFRGGCIKSLHASSFLMPNAAPFEPAFAGSLGDTGQQYQRHGPDFPFDIPVHARFSASTKRT
jgi:hypothetical protein